MQTEHEFWQAELARLEGTGLVAALAIAIERLREIAPPAETVLERQARLRAHGLQMYAEGMRAVGHNVPANVGAGDGSLALLARGMQSGQMRPIGGVFPEGMAEYYAERRENALRMCESIRRDLRGDKS